MATRKTKTIGSDIPETQPNPATIPSPGAEFLTDEQVEAAITPPLVDEGPSLADLDGVSPVVEFSYDEKYDMAVDFLREAIGGGDLFIEEGQPVIQVRGEVTVFIYRLTVHELVLPERDEATFAMPELRPVSDGFVQTVALFVPKTDRWEHRSGPRPSFLAYEN